MDARKATEMLCRSYASLSLSTAVPRTALPSSWATSRRSSGVPICQTCRRLSTQAPRLQPTATTRKPEPGSDYTQDIYKTRDTFLPSRSPSASSEQPTATPRSFGKSRPRTTTLQRSSPKQSSVDDFINSASAASRPPSWGVPTPQSKFSANDILFPTGSASSTPKPRVVQELGIHVKPRTGRSIAVKPEVPNDLGSKLRALEVLCARNRIKADFNRQKFHERPGLKRKRLAGERWRRNFRARFNGVVGRVNDLRVQGW